MSLYVGNLSYEVTEADLNTVFAEYGTVKRVQLPTDRETGRVRGFGFVEMPNREEAEAALRAMEGKDLLGRPLRCNESQQRDAR